MKKILENYLHCFMLVVAIMLTVVLCAQTDNGAAGAGADSDAGVAIETFTDMQVVKEKGKNILLKVKMDVPSDYPELQKYICSKMFGTDDNSLEKGYIKYLSRHEVVKDDALAAKMAKKNKDVTTLRITVSRYKPDAYLSYDAILLYNGGKVPGEVKLKEYHILFDLQTRKVMGYHDVFATDEFALKAERESDWNFALAPDEGVLYAYPKGSDTNMMLLDEIKNQLTDRVKSFIDWNAVRHAEDCNVQNIPSYEPLMTDFNAYLKMDDGVCRLVYNNRFRDVRDFSDSEIDGLINGNDPKINVLREMHGINISPTYIIGQQAKNRLSVIGREIRLAKDYMEQQAKKKAGTFVEDENTIYSFSDCDIKAEISRDDIGNIVRSIYVPIGKFTYMSFLIDKHGYSVVPILESDIHLKTGELLMYANIINKFREGIRKWSLGKKYGRFVHTVVKMKFTRSDMQAYEIYEEVPDDEVAE